MYATCLGWVVNDSCFTNHAVDQFSMNCLGSIHELRSVRIGSRSKNESLQRYNIEVLLREQRKKLRSHAEKIQEGALHRDLNKIVNEMTELCQTLTHGQQKIKWRQIEKKLREH